jgi:predicted dehydrogenase
MSAPSGVRPLRVAMAGAGFASRLHLDGWRRRHDAEVVAICDPLVDKAAERARAYGIPAVFGDAATMLDAARPDAIDIVAPMAEHVALCRLAAQRGVAILCQKPLAPSLRQASELAADVRGTVRLMVHENWRFRAQYRQIRRWLASGELGDVHEASMQVRASGLLADARGVYPQLERQPSCASLERFMIGEVMIHQLDVLRWLLGPLRVAAARVGRACPAIRGEDHAFILLDGPGCRVTLDGSYVCPDAPPTPADRLEIVGTRGVAVFEGSVVRLRGARSEAIEVDLVEGYGDSYAASIAHFVESLRTGDAFETDIDDNLQTLALVEQAYALAQPLH